MPTTTILAGIGLAITAGATAYSIYGSQNSTPPSAGASGSVSYSGTSGAFSETPEERQFYEQQALFAQQAEQQQTAAVISQAQSSEKTANAVQIAVVVIAVVLLYRWKKKK